MEQHAARAAGQRAGQAVSIADSEHGNPAGPLGRKLPVISRALPSRKLPHLGHPGLEGEHGAQLFFANATQRQPHPGIVPAQLRVAQQAVTCQQVYLWQGISPLLQPIDSLIEPAPLLSRQAVCAEMGESL